MTPSVASLCSFFSSFSLSPSPSLKILSSFLLHFFIFLPILSSPRFLLRFPVSWIPVAAVLIFAGPSTAYLGSDSRTGSVVQCRLEACSMAPMEGESGPDPLPVESNLGSGVFPTTQLPSQPLRVTCRSPPGSKISTLDSLCLAQLPASTRVLEISNLTLAHLSKGKFPSNLSQLRKLDLHGNGISTISSGAFEGLANLKRLDLSGNLIASVDGSHLRGLKQLVRLKLGHNPLKHLDEDLFHRLSSLKAIELTETELECDCRLKWLLEHPYKEASRDALPGSSSLGRRSSFFRRKPIRLLGSPTCSGPPALRGFKLKKVPTSRMRCQSKSEVTSVEINPILDQVVFAGDSLRLQCKVSGRDKQQRGKVWWKWGQKHLVRKDHGSQRESEDPSVESQSETGIESDQEFKYEDILVKSSQDDGTMVSFVEIPQVSWGHSGEWSCMAEGPHNRSRTISIYVIHHDTKYCPANVTSGNKGIYSWPRTVASVTVDLPCQGLSSFHQMPWPSSSRQKVPSAEHTCGEDGLWHKLNTSVCPYISETTRILEHFANTNLTLAKTTLHESVKTLRNFTQTAIFKGPDDITLLSKTLEQYVELLRDSPEDHYAAQVLADIIGSTSSLSKNLLRSAEMLDRSCTRLVKSLGFVANKVSSLESISSDHIHLRQLDIHPESFSGISCLWFRKSRHSTNREFKCSFTNYTANSKDEVLDASIQISAPLLVKTNSVLESSADIANETNVKDLLSSSLHLQFLVYDSSNLFPSMHESSWKITSPVIGFKVVGAELLGPLDVYVTLRSAIYSHNILPALWKEGTSTAHGNWTNDACKVVRVMSSLVSFHCRKQGHYGLLQDMAALYGHKGEKGAPFQLSSPGVYVGSTICCLFLMASIATWSIHHQHIHTMSKNKHSFINTWVAILFLVALFTVGIYQTETPLMCQVIGVILHYLTTCVLLWIIVSVTNLYKKVTKTLRPPVPPDDTPSESNLPPPKPMLRFYLVGWGIALILCGISTAVNLRHYNTYNYCFLGWNQSLAAFYAPAATLVFILVTFFVITQCVLRSSHGGYSDATGNTETTELELLDAVSPTSENPPSGGPAEDELSVASQTSSFSLLDGQHSPTTQLRAHVVTLLLFVLTWASAAITTASPFSSIIPYHTTIFSIVYAICSSSLGIFIFVFFCLSRSDVLEIWKDLLALCSTPAKEDETQLTVANNVTVHSSNESSVPTSSINNNQIAPSASPVLAPSVRSVGSSNTHPTNKSSSLSQSLHASNKQESTSKASNALHALNFSSFTDNIQYAPELFYNPKQVGVAKRFFQKQRLKQMMKQNNLDMNRPDSDCNSSTVYCPRTNRTANSESDVSSFDPSCLGLSNKVNNTNIHIDGPYVSKQSSKNLTPELLCVLGPPKNSCRIVSCMENDQHQWPVTFHYECNPNSLHSQKNKSPLPPSDVSSCPIYPFLEQADDIKSCERNDVKSPNPNQDGLVYSSKEGSPLIIPKPPLKERERRQPSRGGRTRQNRPKRRRSRSRDSQKDDEKHWSEEESSHILGTNSLPVGPPTCTILQRDNPTTATSSPPIPVCNNKLSSGSLGKNEFASSSPHPSRGKTKSGYPSACSEMEWLHLLQKRTNSPLGVRENDFFCCDKDLDPYPPCCSDGDSTEGGGECDAWDNDLEITDWSEIGPNMACNDRDSNFDMIRGHRNFCRSNEYGDRSSDCETSSIATSLIPGVDTSPPASLPVSDSPFDSPLHKFHQNTPDSLSLDSGSLLSPLKSQFSSCDNPSFLNDTSPGDYPYTTHSNTVRETPTLTLTISTPVNTPVYSFTPTDTPMCSLNQSMSSQEKDLNGLPSPSRTLVHDASPSSNEVAWMNDLEEDSLDANKDSNPRFPQDTNRNVFSEEAEDDITTKPPSQLKIDGNDPFMELNGNPSPETEAIESFCQKEPEDGDSCSGNTVEQDSTSSSIETDV